MIRDDTLSFRERTLIAHEEEQERLIRTLEAEALGIERLPEGQDPDPVLIDGRDIRPKKRVRGTLKMRF